MEIQLNRNSTGLPHLSRVSSPSPVPSAALNLKEYDDNYTCGQILAHLFKKNKSFAYYRADGRAWIRKIGISIFPGIVYETWINMSH